MRLPLLLMLLSLFSWSAYSKDRCGLYEGEGWFESGIFRLNEHTHSELRIRIANTGDFAKKLPDGVGARLRFAIVKDCDFDCEGEIKRVVRILEPQKKAEDFSFDRARPVRTMKCR